MLPTNPSPEVAYRFFVPHFANHPGVEDALKKALLLPEGTPEYVSAIMQSYALGQGLEFTDDIRAFTILALEHMQFLAQVEAGVYDGK